MLVKPRIPLSEPCVEGNSRRYLEECLETNYVSSVGPFVDRFEREFAGYVGSRFAVACSSGTAALHVAMRLLDLESRDEVLVSTLTFIASANPILYERANPVFVDSERETWNLDPHLVAEELERRARLGLRQPKAVLAVHVLGQPANLEPIVEACERFGVALVEDAAESLGASYAIGRFRGKQTGTIGKIGCFSFNGNKIITTGGGGMIVTDDEALARRAKHLCAQARLPGADYRHDEIGFNYRMNNLAAALGVAQLERLPEFLEKKRRIAARYDQAFRQQQGILPAPSPEWSKPSFWLNTALFESSLGRDSARRHLAQEGIESRSIWSPLHTQPMYRNAQKLGGAVAEDLFSRALSLPSSVNLSTDDQETVIREISSCFPRP